MPVNFFLHDVILYIKNNSNVCFYTDIYIKKTNYKITLADYSALMLQRWYALSLKHGKPIHLDSIQLMSGS